MKKIKSSLLVFIILLLLSGITAFPLKTEIGFLVENHSWFPLTIQNWIARVNYSLLNTPELVFYGTDWLAFAHIVIALFFIPVYSQPVRYKANVIIGMITCAGVFFVAFICGPIRGIPFFHQLIDCAFGAVGLIILYNIYTKIKMLETEKNN